MIARRNVVILAALALLAMPGVAQAASKVVKVPKVADGNVSIAQYTVKKKGKAPKAKVVRKAGLGDRKVIATVQKVKRGRYLLTVVALNPQGASGAAGTAAAPPGIQVYGVGRVTVAERDIIVDVLDASLPDEEAMDDFCDSQWGTVELALRFAYAGLPPAKARAVARAIRLYLCEDGDEDEIEDAYDTLDDLGIEPPACFGHVEQFQGSAAELIVLMTCVVSLQALGVIGPEGSQGTNCFAQQGSCSWGPGCSAFDAVRAVCFSYLTGYPVRQMLAFNVRYDRDVVRNQVALLYALAYLVGSPPGSQASPVWLAIGTE